MRQLLDDHYGQQESEERLNAQTHTLYQEAELLRQTDANFAEWVRQVLR